MDTTRMQGDAGDDRQAADRRMNTSTEQGHRSGPTSSTVTRDAAQLRSMMARAAERSSNAPTEEASASSSDGSQRRPTTLRRPNASSRTLRSLLADPTRAAGSAVSDEDYDGETRMRAPGSPRVNGMTAGAVMTTAPQGRAVGASGENIAARVQPETIPHAGDRRGPDTPPRDLPTPAASASEPVTRRIDGNGDMRDRAYQTIEPGPGSFTGSSPRRPSRRPGPMLALVAVLAGTAIGVGLYAGGADIISSIFSRNHESAAGELNPAAVTDRPLAPPVAPSPAAAASDAIATQGAATGAQQTSQPAAASGSNAPPISPLPSLPATRSQAPPPEVVPQRQPIGHMTSEHEHQVVSLKPSTMTPKPTAAKPAMAESGKPSPSKPTAAQPPKHATTYVVQVRATTDESEASRIMRRLRAAGAAGVTIDSYARMNGPTLYRVRYTASGTQADAQAAAHRAGYDNVWIVPKK